MVELCMELGSTSTRAAVGLAFSQSGHKEFAVQSESIITNLMESNFPLSVSTQDKVVPYYRVSGGK
jgi:hypothetical protein